MRHCFYLLYLLWFTCSGGLAAPVLQVVVDDDGRNADMRHFLAGVRSVEGVAVVDRADCRVAGPRLFVGTPPACPGLILATDDGLADAPEGRLTLRPDSEELIKGLQFLMPSVRTVHVVLQGGPGPSAGPLRRVNALYPGLIQVHTVGSEREAIALYRDLMPRLDATKEVVWIADTALHSDSLLRAIMRFLWNGRVVVISGLAKHLSWGATLALAVQPADLARYGQDVSEAMLAQRDARAVRLRARWALNMRAAQRLGVLPRPGDLGRFVVSTGP